MTCNYKILITILFNLFLKVICNSYTTEQDGLTSINLKQGKIMGRIVKPKRNSYLVDVEVYLGIPYAAPPVGTLRFMPPGAPLPWKEPLNATTLSPVCPQTLPKLDEEPYSKMSEERNNFIKKMKPFLKNENENCLYLNIYVPREKSMQDSNGKHAVIMFIHGESFEWNSGNLYDGSVIASYGSVIFVTLNFRLGIFGFLKPGLKNENLLNFGLLDQVAALKWIKDNIEKFGGDPDRITIMGHGTGAACANFLMLSPVADGLFQRAILMSGSALSEWALTADPLLYTLQVAENLSCSQNDIRNCLQRKRKEDIMSVTFDNQRFRNTFTPVVDEIVVLNSPMEKMSKYSDLFGKYDLLAGVTEVESYYMMEELFLRFGISAPEGRTLLESYTKTRDEKFLDILKVKIFEKYLDYRRSPNTTERRNAVLDALSDALVVAPLIQTVKYHSKTKGKTYFYVFGHHTLSEDHVKIDKSVNGDDLPYVLGVPLDGPFFHYQSEYNITEERLSETVMRYWTNFAKTGDPNMPSSFNYYTLIPSFQRKQFNIHWPTYDLRSQTFLYLGIPPHVKHSYRIEYERFWNEFLPDVIRNYSINPWNSPGRFPYPFESDDSGNMNYPPTYDMPLPPNLKFNNHHNFFKYDGEEKNTKNPSQEPETVSSGVSLTLIIIIGSGFLIVNLCIFFLLYRKRQSRPVFKQTLFNNGRCDGINLEDILNDDETEERYTRRHDELEDDARRNVRKDESTDSGGYDAIRVASVNPEAMSGKRMMRWPLSRQCSGSTITVDPHTKVKEWITHEIIPKYSPRLFRRDSRKKTKIPKTQITKQVERAKAKKISIGVDATPAARTESVLKQIPIELTKSLDESRFRDLRVLRPSVSLTTIPTSTTRSDQFGSEGANDSSRKNTLHKSKATIRLRTPAIIHDKLLVSHSHSKSDPSPMNKSCRKVPYDPIYSQVNKKNRKNQSHDSNSSSAVNSSSHYEDISIRDNRDVDKLDVIRRDKFPKDFPQFPQTSENWNTKRMSLPFTASFENPYKSTKIPPAPPPRLTSTLGRKATMDEPETQLSQLTVHLKKKQEDSSKNQKIEPEIIIRPSLPSSSSKPNLVSYIPRVKNPISQPPAKNTRSVTTSTTGIPKFIPVPQIQTHQSSNLSSSTSLDTSSSTESPNTGTVKRVNK